MLKPDINASVQFLKRWRSAGPWSLTSIGVDKKSIQTRTFYPDTENELRQWLANHGGKRNIYFHVNLATHDLTKKAGREDIKEVSWLHVDLDPRVGEDLETERERCLKLLQEPPQGIPKPTVCTFSGGGYQGFWKLEEPISINGDLTLAEEAKRYNQQLEVLFGADNCHNIDRIMRLSGSINLPDAKKKQKGRTPTMATLEWFDEELVYPLSNFTQVPVVQSAADLGFSSQSTVQVSGNVQRIADVEELSEWNVPDRIKVIIVQGRHPEEGPKEKDDSRSSWLFDCLCGLVRADVPDDVIFSILTDPDLGISESVLDKGSNAEKYAIRQIERAKEKLTDFNEDPVGWVNARYFAVTDGGRVRYYRDDPGGILEKNAMDLAAFKFELAPKQILIPDKKPIPAEKIWSESPRRRHYSRGFTLSPHGDEDGYYNLWQGFSVNPIAGDWSLLKYHIVNILADGNQALADYIIHWAAWSVQNPDLPPRVALVFRGGEGVGKGVFCRALVELFGMHGLHISSSAHLVGRFNAHLRHICMLFADEAVTPKDGCAGNLKAYITEPTIAVEAKGKDTVQTDNHLHVLMASNSDWVVPAGADARRFAVFNVASHKARDHQYFNDLIAQLNNGGKEALLWDLLNIDLGSWTPDENRPETTGLSQQRIASLYGLDKILFTWLFNGVLPSIVEKQADGVYKIQTGRLTEYLLEHHRLEVTGNKVSDLFGAGGGGNNRAANGLGLQKINTSPRGYLIPALPEARGLWDEGKFKVDWQDDGQWEVLDDENDDLRSRAVF